MSAATTPSSAAIGFVGAGQMGGPMVERILAAGIPLHLYARKPEVAEEFAAKGAVLASSLPELASQCDVIIVCLFSDAQLAEVSLGDGGLLGAARPGTVIASHTTAGVNTIQQMAEVARARGAEVVDAPVSGTAADILAGKLTVLLAGRDGAIERCSVPMRAYGAALLRVGHVGDATKIKLLNNALFTSQLRLVLDMARLATSIGIDPGLAISALRKCSGDSFALGVVDRFGVGSAAQAEPFLVKDVATVREVAAELGADLGLLGQTAGDGRLSKL